MWPKKKKTLFFGRRGDSQVGLVGQGLFLFLFCLPDKKLPWKHKNFGGKKKKNQTFKKKKKKKERKNGKYVDLFSKIFSQNMKILVKIQLKILVKLEKKFSQNGKNGSVAPVKQGFVFVFVFVA